MGIGQVVALKESFRERLSHGRVSIAASRHVNEAHSALTQVLPRLVTRRQTRACGRSRLKEGAYTRTAQLRKPKSPKQDNVRDPNRQQSRRPKRRL